MSRSLAIVMLSALMLLLPPHVQADREKTLALPPESIAQWYKPANKRQVWLHTMFRLRREMLAISDYMALEDTERLKKWSGRLARDYRKIGEMVPEWEDELELDQVSALQRAAETGDFRAAATRLRKLGMSCRSCHREYRAVTAALYRSADFSRIKVEDSESLEDVSYEKAMDRLSLLINRIKIASEDGRKQAASDALGELRWRLSDLGQSCEQCHKDSATHERILGAAAEKSLAELEQGLVTNDVKKTGRELGGLAVEVCARCHSVHRTLYDLKKLLSD